MRLTLLALALALLPSASAREPKRSDHAEVVDGRPPLEAHISWQSEGGQREGSPLSLTASDGSGLALRSVEVRSAVQDPLALTELQLVFHNPEERVREGRFEITLPPGAAVSRFAMKIDGQWQEGEVVEKAAARRAYEDFLHRKQDPALLEMDAGNRFRARVFPIPAGADKEIVIAYSQELRGSAEPWQVMLQGLPEVEHLDATVVVDTWGRKGAKVLEVHEEHFRPEGDLSLVFSEGTRPVGLRAGELGVARVAPLLQTTEDPVSELTVLVDTSASRALGFSSSLQRLDAVLEALGPGVQVQVLAFDQGVESVYAGTAPDFGTTEIQMLERRGALGASDLESALRTFGSVSPYSRLLVVTDGVATAGATEAADLRAAVQESGVRRVDAMVVGGIRDEALLSELVTADLPAHGLVLDESLSVDEVATRLGRATASGIGVEVPGARWVWPQTLDGIQSGDEVLVYAAMEDPDLPMEVWLDGAWVDRPVAFAQVERPLLERSAVKALLDRLESLRGRSESPEEKAEVAAKMVDLSTRHRVLCAQTALLVLETEEDYVRYGIERSALADILIVDQEGVRVVRREDLVLPPPLPNLAEKGKVEKKPKAAATEFDPGAPPETTVADGAPPPPAPPMEDAFAEADLDMEEPVPMPMHQERMAMDVSESLSRRRRSDGRGGGQDDHSRPERLAPTTGLEGRMAEVVGLVHADQPARARELAWTWRHQDPGDVLALLALGEAAEAEANPALARRAYGSIIDLYPSRADMRRLAGERLDRVGDHALASDTYGVAAAQRPDHPHGHRLLAWSLVRQGRYDEAFEALEAGLGREYPGGRFAGWQPILSEDLGMVAAAWIHAEPQRRGEILQRLEGLAQLEDEPSTRFVLMWETDANDVDFHIWDGKRGHAFYSQRELKSGGHLYADVTTGYGPECFTIRGEPRAWPYTLQAHYYSRGPMGYGMGTLQVIEHDGQGRVWMEDRPFVIMEDGAYVDLGVVESPLHSLPGTP